MDIGTISIVLLFGMLFLLGIGMPLGFASGFLALAVLLMKFGPDLLFSNFGTGPLNILAQRIYGLMTSYPIISVPLFIFMAVILERSGIARDMYTCLNFWLSRTRGGIAIVTSIMAIIMAAMSGIIGGEVVLLGLIALPQMLRLGYNRNLAIGTICASGSLGTMIPPSIVLIIYGLITETSIKALFTASFLPGFMLASFFIVYIIIRSNLRPSEAPLPGERPEDISRSGTLLWALKFGSFPAILVLLGVAHWVWEWSWSAVGAMAAGYIILMFGANKYFPSTRVPLQEGEPNVGQKALMFSTLLMMLTAGLSIVLLIRAGFMHVVGRNSPAEGEEVPGLVSDAAVVWITVVLAVVTAMLALYVHPEKRRETWEKGKGLIAPLLVVGVVLGSIYGGITGITEAAAMGCVAVMLLTILRGEMNFKLIREALMRTFKSTGTIIWVTFGATALAGAYTIAGGPTYVANLIIGADLPAMGIILVMMLIFLILGALMDWVGIVLLVMPVFLPIVLKLPVEEIGLIGTALPASFVSVWFGVVFCMNMQVSFLSPPFGPAAFYLKSVAPPEISLTDIFRGFMPFIGIQLLALAVLLAWPGLTHVFF